MEIADIVSRCGLGAIGIFFVYVGLFLYEGEERAIQNRLEIWWLKLKEKESTSKSTFHNFVMKLIVGFHQIIQKLVGAKLLSPQSIGTSLYIALLSIFIYSLIVMNVIQMHLVDRETLYEDAIILMVVIPIILLFLAYPTFLRKFLPNVARAFIPIVPIFVILWLAAFYNNQTMLHKEFSYQYCTLMAFILILFSFTINTLHTIVLKKVSSNFTINKFLAFAFIFYLLFPAFAVFDTLRFYQAEKLGRPVYNSTPIQVLSSVVTYMGTFWILFSIGLICLAALLVLHLIVWPFISRPIYAAARYKLINRHKTLCSIGVALILYSIPATPQFIKTLLKTFISIEI